MSGPPSPKSASRDALPLYKKVKAHLLSLIETGALKPGDRAPSESELVSDMGVSRMTANRALRELHEAGFVTRIPGVGTFVAETRAHGTLVAIRDIADELAENNHLYSARVLMQQEEAATDIVARRFRLAPGARLFRARVLHLKDGVPIVLEDRYVHPDIAPDYLTIDLTQETSHRHLIAVAPLQEVEHVIRAIPASADMRTHLALEQDEPCLLVRRRTWTHGKVASSVDLIHAASRYEITGRFKP